MAVIKISYVASSAVPITLASLAASSNLLVGVESDAVDNSSGLYLGDLVGGRITTGTSPTAGLIQVWVAGTIADAIWPDVMDGTNSAETLVLDAIKYGYLQPIYEVATDTTANRSYDFGPVDVASRFGGVLPRKYSFFVTHSTVAALHATAGNHYIHHTPYYFTSI